MCLLEIVQRTLRVPLSPEDRSMIHPYDSPYLTIVRCKCECGCERELTDEQAGTHRLCDDCLTGACNADEDDR